MKVECLRHNKKKYTSGKMKKSLMATWDDSNSEKNNYSSNEEHANIYLIVDTKYKVDIKTCFEFDALSSSSSHDEEQMPYDVLL